MSGARRQRCHGSVRSEHVQPFGDLPGLSALVPISCNGDQAIDERTGALVLALLGDVTRGPRQPIVELFDDIGPDELITVTRYRPDIARLAGIVAKRASQRPDRLRQRPVRDDHVGPDVVEDRLLRNGVAALLDEEPQEVEVLGNQGNGRAVSHEQPLARRQDELAEAEPSGRRHS